jgi:hypothetical protein
MRDFPIFTTENGVGSITLKEVPYKGIAYIKIQSSQQPEAFLQECVDFCKMTGAEKIYASGHEILEAYPLHNAIWQMSTLRENLPEIDAALFPVTEKTAELWRNIYNEKMRPVDNSASMTRQDMVGLVKQGGGYFIHKGDELLGIGIARGEYVESVIAVKPGAGREVMLALCGSLTSERVILEVASTNEKAIRLYEKLGFLKIAEISRWYDVLTRKNT